jgi:hypothetical protein
MSPSEAETARLKGVFQGMHDPAEIQGVNFEGKTPGEIQKMMPAYDEKAQNPMFGIFVDAKTGKAYGFQSGLNPGETTLGEITYRRGTLSSVEIENTSMDFVTLEAHIESQVSAFMRKYGIIEGNLFINGSTPCLGPIGCNQNLPSMLPPNSKLGVYGTGSHGVYFGQPD